MTETLSDSFQSQLRQLGFRQEGDRYEADVPRGLQAPESAISAGIPPISRMMQHFSDAGVISSEWTYNSRSHCVSLPADDAAALRLIR